MVLTRLSGQSLAHGVEGFGAGTSLVVQLQLLFNLPAIVARIIDQWVDMQIRLHQLPPVLRIELGKALVNDSDENDELEVRAPARGNDRCNLTSTETARRFYLSNGYVENGPLVGGFGTSSSYPMYQAARSSL